MRAHGVGRRARTARQLFDRRRPGPGRRHRQHPHAGRRQFHREVLGDLQQGRLGRRIDRASGRAELAAGAAHVHHHAAAQPGRDELGEDRGRHQVGVQRRMPLLAAGSQALVGVLAGVVDQDVDPAEGRQRGLDAALDLRVLADVGLAIQRPFAQLIGQRLAGRGIAADQHHVGASRGQPARDIRAQPLRAAGDDGGLAGQAGKALEIHDVSLFSARPPSAWPRPPSRSARSAACWPATHRAPPGRPRRRRPRPPSH